MFGWFRRAPPAPVRPPIRQAPAAMARPRIEPRLRPGEVFTPTQPKSGRRQIVGRKEELGRILEALREERAHVVLYTDRGRGKTTLANLVVETLRQGGTIVARHTCEAGSTFDSLMRGLMRDLPRSLLAGSDPAGEGEGCEAALPPHETRPRDVVALMSRLTCRTLVCVVDEFDRIETADARTRLADTIKQLSDQAVPLAFMIVGVAENLEQIIGQHPSIQRNLVAVQLPLLSEAEVAEVIEKGARDTGIAFAPAAIDRIVALACGSPYMAQLVGLRMVQAATRRGSPSVAEEDFYAAARSFLQEAPARHRSLRASLTAGGMDAEMVQGLLALAAAPQDQHGQLRAVPSFRDGVTLAPTPGASSSAPVHINAERWGRILAAGIVRPTGEFAQYVFTDRSFMHHLLLLGLQPDSGGREPSLQMIRSDRGA